VQNLRTATGAMAAPLLHEVRATTPERLTMSDYRDFFIDGPRGPRRDPDAPTKPQQTQQAARCIQPWATRLGPNAKLSGPVKRL